MGGARASLTKCQPHLLVVHPVSTNEALATEYRRYNLNIKCRGNAASSPPGGGADAQARLGATDGIPVTRLGRWGLITRML